ncbi:ATP-dependent RecD-like DNA helicase [Pseudomonas fluorescens]|uniref:ATP-dependent RecD-like DNA helicase n=1 Tax=Pseudomonas fluorescens TaxID=294 RepID=A0A5E7U4Q7_PSEFL|nr:AAA family ATPase [Pseudomonas fluorescens]VVQ02824.1 ATP-dependent RecD-like DNA helicase [Pseudomonas fluorescens]
MNSDNFLPLKSRWPQLYQHASLAERYVFSDPHTTAIKLRCFAEALVGILYRELRLHSEPTDGFFEKLKSPHFQDVVGDAVLQKLHTLRMLGNKAAHGCFMDAAVALSLIEEAYLIGQWFYKAYSGESLDGYPPYPVFAKPSEHAAEQGKSGENLAEQLTAAKDELSRLEAAEKAAQAEVVSLNQTLDEAKLRDFKNSSTRAARTIDFKPANTRKLISIHDAFAGYSLTGGQAELVNRLERFLDGNTESVFLLKGYAGTGKTFVTKGLTEYFRAIGRNYVLAAPTGKASKVIASKTKSPAYTIHKTIYSFDDIAEYRDDDTDGTETFKLYAQLAVNSLSADTVYIVDEASMIADVYQEAEFFRFGTGFLLADFLKFVNLDHNDHCKKVIFIGDDAQLPPVGMNFSPALDADYLFREHHARSNGYELSEVVRQKSESGVIANAIPLRKSLQAKVFNRLAIDFGHPDVRKVEHQDLMTRYLESCGGKINGEAIVIAHSNSDVGDYNRRIREHFFPGCPEVMPGDKVMAVSNSDACGIFISNGDFGLIRQVLSPAEKRTVTLKRKSPDSGKLEEIPVALTFRDVVVGFKDLEGVARFFQTKILEDLLYSKEPALSSDQNKALYLDFCIRNEGIKRNSAEFKHTLKTDPYFNALRLKFGYAITCHKAQGSEWNHVFVKCKSNQSQLTADYFRWLYTAITRTTQNLYLLDPPNLQPWSGIKMISDPALEMLGTAMTQEVHPAPSQPFPFGIPASASFLLSVLAEVRKLINGKGIAIEDVFHNQYQEVYHFKREAESARIDIAYNGKNKITGIVAPHLTDLSAELASLLSALKGQPLFAGGGSPVADTRFAKQFLNDFHEKVLSLCSESGIAVHKVVEQQWSQRYSFAKDGAVAVYDVWYNGKDQFTKCQPLITACSPGSLVGDIGLLLTEGMRG